jgi:flagellar export protein FliJ
MTTFRFPLKRVLDWRHTQLELEEARYKQQAAVLAELDRAGAEIEGEGIRAEVQVRKWDPISGFDLEALSRFRARVKSRQAQVAAQRADCAKKMAGQQKAMLEARRRCKLLERLEERKLAEWQAARDRELDELATESYLAKWK